MEAELAVARKAARLAGHTGRRVGAQREMGDPGAKVVRRPRVVVTRKQQAVRAQVAWGPGPRSGQAFMLAARARALLDGRFAPSADDVAALAGPILAHRMALTFSARADGVTVDDVIAALVAENV